VKFLVDNQLPAALARWLASRGYDAMHVLDVGLADATDRAILNYAISNESVVVSKDEDFSRLIIEADSPATVVWVRLGNCRTKTLLQAFDSAFPQILASLEAGTRLIEIK
jgi:predicted nuclease of predicted toxin-antitoxin system